MGPNTAFCFVLLGVLGIYCEFTWPGRVWQAMAGGAAAATGGYFLWRASFTALGSELIAAAVALYLFDAYVDTRFAAGVAATGALSIGFIKLISGDGGIRPIWAVPCCAVFGAVTVSLNWVARRARRNKSL